MMLRLIIVTVCVRHRIIKVYFTFTLLILVLRFN